MISSSKKEKETNNLKNFIPGTHLENLLKGFLCLILYLIFWECGAMIGQQIQKTYSKFYFITWFSWIPNIAYLLFYYPFIQYTRKKKGKDPYKITKEDWKHALILFFIDIVCASTYLISLRYTIVNISNTLCLGTCVWSYFFSILLVKEKITLWKNLSVGLVLCGVVVIVLFGREVTNSKSTNQNSSVGGYLILLVGEILYALSGVLYSKFRQENRNTTEDTLIFMGMLGVVNTFIFWIPLIPLHYIGWEIFELPSAYDWLLMLIFAVSETSAIAFGFMGISYMGPVFMSIGVVLILPIGNITEYIFSNTTFNEWYYVGMSVILLAFSFYTYGEYQTLITNKNKQKDHQSAKCQKNSGSLSFNKDADSDIIREDNEVEARRDSCFEHILDLHSFQEEGSTLTNSLERFLEN